LPAGFDSAKATLKRIQCQFQASGTDPSGLYKVSMYPAGYYIGNDGQINLDVEKFANQDTTKVISTTGITALTSYFT